MATAKKLKKKIWVVLVGIDYETYDSFCGAYSTKKEAEKRLKEFKSWDGYKILETTLDTPHKVI